MAKNVEMVVICSECEKPQVLYSQMVVQGEKRKQLLECLEDIQYSCGCTFDDLEIDDDKHVLKSVFVKKNLTCSCNIEITYFSAGFEEICYYCGSDDLHTDEDGNDPDEAKKFYPLCTECKELGKKNCRETLKKCFSIQVVGSFEHVFCLAILTFSSLYLPKLVLKCFVVFYLFHFMFTEINR